MIQPGSKLAHYEVVSALGKGGMGEVWRARDSKLGREVAIKTLPEEFAEDEERLARLEREAKLLASLNHPNIATIHGLEEYDGTLFLVLELVEGDTLADRLKRGAIPAEESLRLALQIAEALEAAHEKGVIHRDLKPANIKVTPDGKVKVLDFGLAKAFAGDGADASNSNSPTLSIAATQQGMILGTAAYMSPEQARGQEVDKRTDIWALGCVLLEMLTGRQAFPGNLASDIIAAVIRAEPDWDGLPPRIHPTLKSLLERCLEKDLRARWHDVADVRVDIEKVQSDPSGGFQTAPGTSVASLQRAIPWALLALMILAMLVREFGTSQQGGTASAHLQIVLPDGFHLPVDTEHPTLALSPDGSQLVFVGEQDGTRRLYQRNLADPVGEIRVIAGTDGAASPFFSPEGDWIGYFDDSGLMKVSADSGVPLAIPGALGSAVSRGGTWHGDEIIYTRSRDGDLERRSAVDLELQAEGWQSITGAPRAQFWPSSVPGTSGLLTTDRNSSRTGVASVSFVSIDTGDIVPLFEGGTNPRYSSTGHVLYTRSGSLYSVPFDFRNLTISGPERRLFDGLVVDANGAAQFSVAANGVLAFVPGDAAPAEYAVVWVDRDGNIVDTILEDTRRFRDPRLSPDGDELALTVPDGPNQEVGILDLVRGGLEYAFRDPGEDFEPVWDPTGRRMLAFSSQIEEDPESLGPEPAWIQHFERGPEVLFQTPGIQNWNFPSSWSPDGRFLAMKGNRNGGPDSVYILDVDTREARPFQDTLAEERSPAFSPNGEWLAYISDANEPGRHQVYVQPFPEGGRPIPISTNGGMEPLWSRDGSELFYWGGDRFMVVTIGDGPGLDPSLPTVLFEGDFDRAQLGLGATPPNYDVSREDLFVMVRRKNPLTPTVINVVLNWPEVFGVSAQE